MLRTSTIAQFKKKSLNDKEIFFKPLLKNMIYADWLLNSPYIVDNIRKQSRLIVLYSVIVFKMIIITVIACIRTCAIIGGKIVVYMYIRAHNAYRLKTLLSTSSIFATK